MFREDYANTLVQRTFNKPDTEQSPRKRVTDKYSEQQYVNEQAALSLP